MENNNFNLDEYTVFEEREFDNILHEFYTINDLNMIVKDRQKKLNDLRDQIKQLWEQKK